MVMGVLSDIREGNRVGLLDGSDAEDLLNTLKQIAGRFLYPADRVQRPFLAGLKITHGILNEYGEILQADPRALRPIAKGMAVSRSREGTGARARDAAATP